MAQIQKYISIKQILDDLLSHPLLTDLTLERVVNYVVTFLRIVGMPQLFLENTADIVIKNHRGVLPCDYLNMIQVRDERGYCFRYSTDSFHLSEKEVNRQSKYYVRDNPDLTYKIQGNCIFTSIENGNIEIAYEAINIDKDGYPLIPDNESFKMALELFIKKEWFTIQFDLGKISAQSLTNVQQQYAWCVGQAQSDLVRPTIDQMESITNMLNTLITRVNEHKRGFKDLGSREYLKLH